MNKSITEDSTRGRILTYALILSVGFLVVGSGCLDFSEPEDICANWEEEHETPNCTIDENGTKWCHCVTQTIDLSTGERT